VAEGWLAAALQARGRVAGEALEAESGTGRRNQGAAAPRGSGRVSPGSWRRRRSPSLWLPCIFAGGGARARGA
jgi:hypothetical protein